MIRLRVAMAWLLVLCACSPSLRMTHRNTVVFETCHAADLDPTLASESRSACWAQWLEHYSEGQPPDRRIYAWERRAALLQGDEMRPIEFQRLAPPEGVDPSRGAPSQSQSSPGNSLYNHADISENQNDSRYENPCNPLCQPRLAICEDTCIDRDRACLNNCETELRICLRGCY